MGPVPLNCDSKLMDEVVDELTSFGSRYKARVIYLGRDVIKKVIGSRVVSRCIKRWREVTLSSTRDRWVLIISIWQLTLESFMPTLSQRILEFSRE